MMADAHEQTTGKKLRIIISTVADKNDCYSEDLHGVRRQTIVAASQFYLNCRAANEAFQIIGITSTLKLMVNNLVKHCDNTFEYLRLSTTADKNDTNEIR
jgi:hypothetical protein